MARSLIFPMRKARSLFLFSGLTLGLVIGLTVMNKLAIGASGSEEMRPAPDIAAETWLNSKPLSMEDLKGKVVLVKFWTFGCYNCNNVEPYIKAWHKKYEDQGLVTIAVHTPEFDYEKSFKNVREYVQKKDVRYPVAIDNDFVTWKRYQNWAWPTIYLIDKSGMIRYKRIGEGGYSKTENKIRELLDETGAMS